MTDEKILKEEILSDGELENVVGGTLVEMMKDTQFLYALGLMDYTCYDIYELDQVNTGDILKPFFKAGLTISFGDDKVNANKYAILPDSPGADLKGISRAEALKIICDKFSPGFDYTKYL